MDNPNNEPNNDEPVDFVESPVDSRPRNRGLQFRRERPLKGLRWRTQDGWRQYFLDQKAKKLHAIKSLAKKTRKAQIEIRRRERLRNSEIVPPDNSRSSDSPRLPPGVADPESPPRNPSSNLNRELSGQTGSPSARGMRSPFRDEAPQAPPIVRSMY